MAGSCTSTTPLASRREGWSRAHLTHPGQALLRLAALLLAGPEGLQQHHGVRGRDRQPQGYCSLGSEAPHHQGRLSAPRQLLQQTIRAKGREHGGIPCRGTFEKQFLGLELQHVPRDTNKEADNVAKRVSRRLPQELSTFEEQLFKTSAAFPQVAPTPPREDLPQAPPSVPQLVARPQEPASSLR